MLEIAVEGREKDREVFRSGKQSVMIGRAAGNDIRLELTGVSRYHATLSIQGDQIVLQDLNSTNGTFVNSSRIQETVINPTDRITIGPAVLSVAFVDELPQENSPVESAQPPPVEAPLAAAPTGTALASEPAPAAAPAESPAAEPAKTQEDSVQDNFYWKSLESFLSPIWPYIIDDSVSEVMINGPEMIYFERKGHLERSDAQFTPDQLRAAVLNIAQYVGRRVSEDEPYLDARLPDGSRVAVLLPPCSRCGISVSIRKFSKEKLSIEKLLEFGSMSKEMALFLKACVVLRKNIIVSGGTSSGKTSLLNVVSGLIPDDERIITIEDSAELQLRQEHVVPMETKPPDKRGRGQITIRDLVKASLRMRPDRIVVGEIRGGEALDLLQAMNTGHSGSMATVHASSPQQALTRLETLALFSGLEIPIRALRDQVSAAIDMVVQTARLPDHSRKVTHISEVGKIKDDGNYQVHDVFVFESTSTTEGGKIIGGHVWTGYVPSIIGEMKLSGLSEAVKLFEKH